MSSRITSSKTRHDEGELLDEILRTGDVYSVFQPLIELADEYVIGYEALIRGPVGDLASPDRLFAAARRYGRLQELDELCRHTAVVDAQAAGIASPLTLFVNVEPEALSLSSLSALNSSNERTSRSPQLVLEITERALAFHPADLLASVQRLRETGWRIALDDVGANDLTLAFMPLLRPDIIKLDLPLVQSRPDVDLARIMNAVNAYAERSGCILLAEGIETPEHLRTARSLGARIGQGWHFGRPAATIAQGWRNQRLMLPDPGPADLSSSPFNSLPSGTELRRSSKGSLLEIVEQLEQQAGRLGAPCLLLATFQVEDHFTHSTADRYRDLATHVGFVGAFGRGLSDEPAPGVRGADLLPGDPVLQEWDVIVLGPHFAGALLARDLGDDGPDRGRNFEYTLTYDRETVEQAARTLMSRIKRTSS